MKPRSLLLAVVAVAAGATLAVAPACRCSGRPPPGAVASAAPSGFPSDANVSAAQRVRELLVAENTRAASSVRDDDLTNPAVQVRRAVARTMARIADPSSADQLLSMLADRDAEVLSWSAYGVGRLCESNRDRFVRALVVRATSLGVESPPRNAALDPWFAIARALGECATPEAERSLVAWLDKPKSRAVAACFGLGDVASHKKRLEEESAAALLQAAAGDAAHDPLAEAFFAFGRLPIAPPRAAERQAELGHARLEHAEAARIFVVRALGKIGEPAIDDLAHVLAPDSGFSPAERAEAGRALATMPSPKAQRALLASIGPLAPSADPAGLTGLIGPGFVPLLAAIEALGGSAKPTENASLRALANLAIPPQAPPAVQHRVVALRCAAAGYFAGSDFDDPTLVDCAPSDSPVTGALARLVAIGRGKLTGNRLAAWRSQLDPKLPARVREAALQLIGAHPEIPEVHETLAHALDSADIGVVTVAAEQITQYPDRAFVQDPRSDDKRRRRGSRSGNSAATEVPAAADVVKALLGALDRKLPPDAVETVAGISRASGALRVEAARSKLSELCHASNPTLRVAAQDALTSMDGKKATCLSDPHDQPDPAAEIDHLLTQPVKLRFETDAGELMLTLDPWLAPIAATRVADLARKGFYNGLQVHRVVAGFVVQFGDPQADSNGGAGLEPLRCETSPVRFDEGVVGVALGGPDTGSSQIFVTLAPAPHLDGRYTVIGKAEGNWSSVAEGDTIRNVTLVP